MYGNLKTELRKKGLTQKDVAKLLHLSTQSVYMKLNGIHDFTAPEMFSIKQTFFPNITLEELFAKR